MPEVFTNEYAYQYENFSAKHPRTYEVAAQALLKTDGGIKDGEFVVEIGSGTGNSSLVFVSSNPNLAKLVCIEPSDFVNLAAYKLGKKELVLPTDLAYSQAIEYIEEQRRKTLNISGKVRLVKGRSPQLPIRTDTVDRVYCSQSFHWFAFQDEVSKANFDYLSDAVREIARILRPGGRLLFDSNGHIYNFGREEIGGRRINDIHFTRHPLWFRFNDNFNEYVVSSGFRVSGEQKGDRLHQIFDFALLKRILRANDLHLISTSNGQPYLLTLVPMKREKIIDSARDGAKMIKFNHPTLKELPEDQKDEIIAKVLKITLDENPRIFEEDFYETFASFVAEKVA